MYYMHAAQADIILFIACLALILSILAVARLFEHADAKYTGHQSIAMQHAHDKNCFSHDLLNGLQTEQKLKHELIKMQVTSQLALSDSQSQVQQLQATLRQLEVCVPL